MTNEQTTYPDSRRLYPDSMAIGRINDILYGDVDLTTIEDGELRFLRDYPCVQLPDAQRLEAEIKRRWPEGDPSLEE